MMIAFRDDFKLSGCCLCRTKVGVDGNRCSDDDDDVDATGNQHVRYREQRNETQLYDSITRIPWDC